VADFPGRRSWGYDGVLPFAPDAAYGTPDELKHLIQAAHRKRIMVLLDVVYNHFGPDGNYLHRYAPQFFTERHHTPWGAAINFDAAEARPVREFFIHNALYWLEEFRFDGLRLDAVHAIIDTSQPGIVDELARCVRLGPGRDREVHLVLENEHNCARHFEREAGGQPHCDAQWNDDAHHAAHVLLTGETDGYYIDYAQKPAWWLARCLAEGFAYQGEASTLRKGEHRGEVSAQLPPTAFVNFIQNHDQVGNRAFGERLGALAPEPALRALVAIYLLAPSIPMLFMGEEFGATSPFLYFCDHHDQLADAVREGRRREFAHFPRFADPAVRESIPDPNDIATFRRSTLDWNLLHDDVHWDWQRYYRQLLALREREIVPGLAGTRGGSGAFDMIGPRAFNVRWLLGNGSRLELLANLDAQPTAPVARPAGEALFLIADPEAPAREPNGLAGWSVLWLIDRDLART
jgi:maltooligosyltrehalose trehalohydrolase